MFPKELDDFYVEIAMKSISIKTCSIGANLRNLFSQCVAAGSEEYIVPRPRYDMLFWSRR